MRQLESVLAKYLKNPDRLPAKRPTIRPPRKQKGDETPAKVDAIDYLTDRIQLLEEEMRCRSVSSAGRRLNTLML